MDFNSHNNINTHMDFPRPSSTLSSMDRKPSTFSFEDNSTLDSNILDTPASIMSPTTSTQGIYSPVDSSVWEDFNPTPFDRSASVVNPNNPFLEQTNNPFTRLPANQAATYGQQSFSFQDNSRTQTPTVSKPLNPFNSSGEFDSAPSSFVPVASHMPSAFPSHGLPIHNNVRPSSVFPSAQPEQPLSPHTNAEWMSFNQQEMDSRSGGVPKRMRANTPPRSFSPRRDGGIRKKNARFDIPMERNLMNIDELIANCKNDEDLKELKQQKRLLRNRQAALDSRQRKKKHTEELEEEKKLWTERVGMLEEQLNQMTIQMDALTAEKENILHDNMEAQNVMHQLQWEKEELVRTHTLETGDLRKKIQVLTERLETSTTNMSVAPSSTYIDFASDMDNLHMGNEWDDVFNSSEFAEEGATPQQQQQQQQTLAIIPRGKDSEDKPVASGLLLMLLLCGAFVASKSSGASSPPIPRMPDEVRAASSQVLDSIFKDAGVAPSSVQNGVIANTVQGLEPAPSALNWPKQSLHAQQIVAGVPGSSLDQLHNQLTMPTKDQENEQLFSMTAAQYNSLTSVDFSRPRYSIASDDLADPLSPGQQPGQHRRNLAQTLAAMREQSKGDTAAEVYTRSLLWDKIPTEVVHEFKRMVEESDRVAASRPSTSDGEVSKVESIG